MASPEEMTLSLPETLPEDFSEWDSEGSPTAELENLRELREAWEVTHSFSETPKPLEESVDPGAAPAPSMDTPRVSGSASPASVFVKQQEDFNGGDSEASLTPRADSLREWEAWEVTHPFSETPKPLEESVDSGAGPASSMDTPRVSGSASSKAIFVKQQIDFEVGDREARPAFEPEARPAFEPEDLRKLWKALETTHPVTETPKPLEESVDRGVAPASSMDTPRDSGLASSASVSVKKQKELSDRDSEASPTSKTDNLREWEARETAYPFSDTLKLLGRSADRAVTSASSMDKPRDSGSASSAPVFAKQQEEFSAGNGKASPTAKTEGLGEMWKSSEWWDAWRASHNFSQAPLLLAQSTGPEQSDAYETWEDSGLDEEQGRGTRKFLAVVAVTVFLTLLALIIMFPQLHNGLRFAAKQAAREFAQLLPEASNTQPEPSEPNPPAGERLTRVRPPATDNQPTDEEASENSVQVPTTMQAQMMDEQLTAPSRISQDFEKQAAEHAPPPLNLGIAGADGLGGSSANVSVFDRQAQPVVEAAPSSPIVISSSVAAGMLIQKSLPVYPPFARDAGVSGTVELVVTISKAGTVKDVQVLNGPVMLRQAAVDAVRTWRYRPYRVNNEPIDVQTTINVLFTLGG